MKGEKFQTKFYRIFLILMFFASVLVFVNLVLADLNYDSEWLCMENGFVKSISGRAGHASKGVSTCGREGNYFIDTGKEGVGEIVIKTPALPVEGLYNLSFNYEIGTANDPYNEDFEVICGSGINQRSYIFEDNILDDPKFRIESVECYFNEGENEIIFKSLDTGSVHFEEFRISNCE